LGTSSISDLPGILNPFQLVELGEETNMIGHRQLTMEDYVAMFRRHRRTLILLAILGPVAGYLVSLILPKQYTSQTVILVQQPAVPMSYVTDINSGDLNARLTSLQEQILSRSRLEGIIDKLGLYSEERKQQGSMEGLVDRLRRKISVVPVKPMADSNSTSLPGFIVKVTDRSPAFAQKLADEVAAVFLQENGRVKHEQATGTAEYLTKKLADAKANLDDQDAKLAAFKARYPGAMPDELPANLNLLAGLNTQLDAATQALSRAQQDKSFTESVLAQQLASQASDNPSAQKQLVEMQNELAGLLAKYTEDHPDVIRLRQSIADLKQKMASSQGAALAGNAATAGETPEVQQLRAQVHQYDSVIKEKTAEQRDIQRQIALYQGRVQVSPSVEEQYKVLTRDQESAKNFYNDLLKKRSESAMVGDMNHQADTTEFHILDRANLPEGPSFPNRLYFSLGGLGAGLALALGIIVLREVRDKALRTEEDVEFFLQLPTLANIPSVENARRRAATGKDSSEGPRLVASA
jgi:polysaccharide chain length determinant protein (PEP-CTERM system associated)